MEFKQVVNPIFHFALRSRYHVFNLGGAIAIPVDHGTQQIVKNQLKVSYVSGIWMTDDSGNWMAFPELLVTKLFTCQVQEVPI